MRRPLKILLALAAVLAVSQAPFAYRRYRLGQLDATIRRLNAARAEPDGAGYADYRGVLHVHTFLGGHSPGTPEEVVEGARANGLAFVVMSEHPSARFDTRALTLAGTHAGVLFVPGSETSEDTRDRFLTFGGAREGGRELTFVAHPETFASWDAARFDGMEVYNLHADAKNARPLSLFFDGLWSYRAYPHLLWTRFHRAPTENLRRFDELTTAGRRVVAVAGNDAHANVGLSLQELSGRPLFQIKLDPYERSFRVVRTHALLPSSVPLTEQSLLDALARGHAYVAFDLLCDATGFRLTATNGADEKIMGDEITLGPSGEVVLRARLPVAGRVALIRDGRRVDEREGAAAEWTLRERGVYRVECYLPQLPDPLDRQPWIISNPIYVTSRP